MPTDIINGVEGIKPYLDKLVADCQRIDFEPFGELELVELEQTHAQYFADATDPVGVAWPQLEPSTIRRKGHATILIDTTALYHSLTDQAAGEWGIRDIAVLFDATEIIFGTRLPYSGILEQPNKYNGKIWRHVGVNEAYVDNFCKRLVDYSFNELVSSGF